MKLVLNSFCYSVNFLIKFKGNCEGCQLKDIYHIAIGTLSVIILQIAVGGYCTYYVPSWLNSLPRGI